jgi:squalene-associated FAD-dependent desaturase
MASPVSGWPLEPAPRHRHNRHALTHTHIIGGGLAGLSAALHLTSAGRPVTIYESSPVCGGRCRSYFDQALGCRIDNGNHLLLSGNSAAMAYLDRIGARDTLGGPGAPVFPFMDVLRGERWTVRPSAGRIPFWLLSKKRRVPGTGPLDYLPLLRLGHARPTDTVVTAFPDGPLYRRLLEPLAIAALNTPTYRGSARLLGAVIDETLAKGGAACIPLFPKIGLSESFVDPAIDMLRAAGAEIRTGYRVAGLTLDGARVRAITGPDGPRLLPAGDQVILATPSAAAASLLPGLMVPDEYQAIVNLHYRLQADPGEAGFIGLTSATAEWVFVKPGVVSVTISAANRLVDRSAEELAETVWPEVQAALGISAPMPQYRVVKEKRATFAATPAQQLRRPSATTVWENCVLAGDWTQTGLPATIEGAIRSGVTAATQLRFAA